MARTKNQASHTHSSSTDAHYEGSQSGLLTLDNAGPIQMGFWVPNRVWATAKFLIPLRHHIAAKKKANTLAPLQPVMQEFKNWVTSHSVYRMWLTSMIEQSNAFIASLPKETRAEIKKDGDAIWIEGYDSFFEILNEIITTSSSFNTTAQVGTPMNAFLSVAMGTEAGVALFHDATFNQQFKPVLNAWNTFLKSSDSLDKLDIQHPEKPGSWISKAAHKAGVWKEMEHDPSKPGYGFDSWNAFFLRQFVKGARPFHGDPKTQIDIGCETTPWKYANKIKLESQFWAKDMNYSLLDLFGGQRQWAKLFEGGQIYQGFLSATHYHRWNSPLDGLLVRSWVEPGTYFAQRPGQGEDQGTWEGTESQPYLGHVATRAIFIFKHKSCGYIALICIGMVEVSSCIIDPSTFIVEEGAAPVSITRGTEIGRFEFGGSTHMMIFQKDRVKLEAWARNAVKHREDPNPTKMGSIIATATAGNHK
ncbi:phophatidylserine decarboxylase associated domain-containing protein [Pectobacteriaceae bacterium CE90]|nr:phosphatidylserine decarboxylase family protein [Prodigiosinella sp. LS101]WJV52987.1 phophatidylserine decarboxylase associated domain-containing protein [Prodigiosinella sp. LS101]WJV57343.1 phophatidylserine decarboxylase associated domain-containing protein [Pectobacteriaceae bacterium C111]WJY15985.1 phophatidylserine decarboxylase associated domain-containing protein [Pectobacteriaceae bacterium CE90]